MQSEVKFPKMVARYRLRVVRDRVTQYGEAERIDDAGAVARFVLRLVGDSPQEQLGALMLDVRYQVIGYAILGIGSATEAFVDTRAIFATALLVNAVFLVVFHNHPSGETDPSPADMEATRGLVAAGRVVRVQVIDHVIVGPPEGWTSIRKLEPALFDSRAP